MAPVLVVIGAMIYIGSLRALHLLTKDDVQFVQGIAPKRFQKLVPLVAKLAGVPT
jgi:hypothetical protein